MKKQGAAGVDFQIEIALGNVGAGGEEEFNTAIFPNVAVVVFGDGADVTVFDTEKNINEIVVV